ncbi:aspartate aminotransferase family protein [Aquibacillus sp. 3ASR75-11]|uniref:Aspartate aminotransferase family protein n=1 Tax=Terrihalobacillus insolitus TaxID=2950438 RepID=A0A9X3WS55_9BACI|nr:aspartate aminotransferase family protein [Terrihalobacillus insolitus]MDC3424410.1 aspartate aminotransferase family protein [Terrihalobacillus insolitus]
MTVKTSKELVENDEKYIWHALRKYNPESQPLIAAEAEGAWITDIDGNQYMDGMSGLWCVNVGYGREELAKAAYEQLKTLPYFPLSNSHVPAIKLGEKLNSWLGDDYIYFFSNSGSEANEVAFKIARQYHQQNGASSRYKFISRYRAYHGNTMGSLAATGQAERKYRYEPLSPGFIHVSPPDIYRSPYPGSEEEIGKAYADEIERVITWEMNETVAGIIMEPIITGGGVIVPPENHLQKVRDICDRHGVLLIIDEVISGFGRTGKNFGFMNFGIKPDIITMAKGITSAYQPLSVTAVRRDIYEVFKKEDEYAHFRHVNTFGGSPAACAVALKNLEILEKEQLVERSAHLGGKLAKEMSGLENHPKVGRISSKGLLMGIELVEDKISKNPAKPELLTEVMEECKSNGLIIGKNGATVAGFNNVLTLCPPLCITDDDFTFMVRTVKEAISRL